MKLVYLAQIGLFDDWAHTVQIMKMCEAFSRNGAEVKLIVPNRKNTRKLNAFEYNNTENNFKIIKLPYIDLFFGNPSPVLYWVRLVSFLASSRVYLFFSKYDVLYTREQYFTPFFRNVFLEKHSLPKEIKNVHISIMKKVAGIIVLTSFIKSKLQSLGIAEKKILVAHDAVRLEDFSNVLSKDEARKKLSIKQEIYVIGYVGTLKTMGMEKGVSTAILSLKFLPDSYVLYVVGGEPYDVDFYKNFAIDNNLSHRVVFTGRVLHKDVPLYISACDVVTAPFPANDHYNYYMSPLKIFEYMASKRPMVVSNLPSLREVLEDRKTSLFVPADDPEALAKAFLELESNKSFGGLISENAYKVVSEKYTWNSRANAILKFISK